MKWLLIAGVVVAAGLIVRALHRHHMADRVSPEWLYQQERRDEVNQFQGVNWQWPVRKASNEASQFNTRRLRKRA